METADGAVYDRATLFGGQPRYAAQSPWGPFAAAGATVVVFLGQLAGVLAALLFIYATSSSGFGMGSYHAQRLLSLDNPIGVGIVVASQLASIGLVWAFASRGGARRRVLQMSGAKPSWGTCVVGGLLVIAATAVVELILYVGIGFDFRAGRQVAGRWPAIPMVACGHGDGDCSCAIMGGTDVPRLPVVGTGADAVGILGRGAYFEYGMGCAPRKLFDCRDG